MRISKPNTPELTITKIRTLSDRYKELQEINIKLKHEIPFQVDTIVRHNLEVVLNNNEMVQRMLIQLIETHGDLDYERYILRREIVPIISQNPNH
jgi:sensor domain CHASE-containing protein